MDESMDSSKIEGGRMLAAFESVGVLCFWCMLGCGVSGASLVGLSFGVTCQRANQEAPTAVT